LDKPWKRFERRIAAVLDDAERVPITGRQRGDAPDIRHEWLSIEAKFRASLPGWIDNGLDQAKASDRGGQLPVVSAGDKGRKVGDCWVVGRLGDWLDFFGG